MSKKDYERTIKCAKCVCFQAFYNQWGVAESLDTYLAQPGVKFEGLDENKIKLIGLQRWKPDTWPMVMKRGLIGADWMCRLYMLVLVSLL